MALNISQLSTPVTEEEATSTLLSWLATSGFVTTSWVSGSVQLTLIRLFASVYARLTEYVATLVSWGFNDTATGEALTRFSRSRYANERNPAVAAQHRVVFTCSASSGPYSFDVGDLIVGDVYGNVFTNTLACSIASGGTLTTTVVCDTPGAAGNVGAVGTIIRMISSFAGVTCSNPAIAGTVYSLLVTGADAETDVELRVRNASKWGTLATENIRDTVENIAINAATGLAKAAIDDTNPRGAGTVDVYVSGATSTAGALDVAAARAAVRARFFNANPRIAAVAAAEYELPITGTIYYDSALSVSDVQDFVEASLDELIGAMPLGGYTYTSGPSGILRLSDVVEAVETATGVIGSSLSVGVGLSYLDIPAFTLGVRPVAWSFVYVGTAVS